MNQKDYKAIAEIIKNQIIFAKGLLSGKQKEDVILVLTAVAHTLADYFEKEDIKQAVSKLDRPDESDISIHKEFDRKQFLKDCGVDGK